ncbi:MAG: hypothetical protein KAR07_01185 [Spirochaetes bacterium]|nr:hypothetical protein [Spirochaetota bacterium]
MFIHFIGFSAFNKIGHSRIFKLAITLILAIFLFALLFWVVEKPYHPQEFTYFKAIESVAIFTISGFDTAPPKTPLGWTSAIISLILGIVLVGAFTAEIASIFVESRMKTHAAVKKVDFRNHVIVCGNLVDIENFFYQFFHPDHESLTTKVVFLMPDEPPNNFNNFLENKTYKNKVKYIIGSPMNVKDLEKSNAAFAKSAFILANRFASNQNEDDSKTILRTLAIEAYNSNIETYVQLLNQKNKKHLKAAGVDNFICIDELSQNLLAQSCLNPGLSTLVQNLVNSEETEIKKDSTTSLKEYAHGAGQEIYRVPTSQIFNGMTFSEAASQIFSQYNITLIAKESQYKGTPHIHVNPGNQELISNEDYLFVIADDFKTSKIVSNCKNKIEIQKPVIKTKETQNENSGWKENLISLDQVTLDKVDFTDHIIICGNIKKVPGIIHPLRSSDLKEIRKAVILCTDEIPESIWNEIKFYQEIYFIKGSPLNFDDLIRSGVSSAKSAIILSNTDNSDNSDYVMMDSDTIMTAMGIETIEDSVYTIAELMYSSNIKFLKPQLFQSSNKETQFSVDEIVSMSKIADSLIYQSFYTPHLLDIFDELFSTEDDMDRNTCEIYLINLPDKYSTKTYLELFNHLSLGYEIICIGLLRIGDEQNYVFTNPSSNTKLKPSDKIYVLAPSEPEI